MPNVLTHAQVLQHVRPIVLVLDEVGTILQAEGTSLASLGFDAEALIGDNALEYVAPGHLEPMMFVFAGPGDHVVRDRHEPFPLELIGPDGNPMFVDCAAERVRHDDQVLWVVTMMPHSLQSASFHALVAYGRGASAYEVAETIAERLAWEWEPGSDIRSFLLADPVDGRFTSATEPGRTPATDGLLCALARDVSDDAPWNRGIGAPHVTVPVGQLPDTIAHAAREAGFVVACVAIGTHADRRHLALVSFGSHPHVFQGNLDMIMTESVKTLDMGLQREAAEEELRRAAGQDALTGLSNRLTFSEALDGRDATTSAVLYIDVDHFKEINDSFGHDVGDRILIEISHRIQSSCRSDDVVARLGGDEFVVLLSDVDPTRAERIAHRVLARISDPLPADIGPESIAASGGLALVSADEDAIERADLAMLESKRSGRAQLVVA